MGVRTAVIRVLVAEDHSLVRAGICALIQRLPGIEVVAETGNGREVVPLVQAYEPNVVLMDIALPGLNGLEVTAKIAKRFPRTKVLILSMHANEEYVVQALRAGAAGYLVKYSAVSELEFALRAVSRGEQYLSQKISRHLLGNEVRRAAGKPRGRELLTPRQREVLQLISEGHSTKKIASLLQVSAKTVETHRAELMRRLDIHDVAGLVRYAIRVGMVTSES